MTFSDERIQRFLGTRNVVLLATLQADGSPLAMPMWFLHDDRELAMISVAATKKVRNLRRDPRVCVVAEAGGDPRGDAATRGVTVQGRVEVVAERDGRRVLADRFLARYAPSVERLWNGRIMPEDRVAFRIVPEHVRSWGLS